jgi:hypothetical protein
MKKCEAKVKNLAADFMAVKRRLASECVSVNKHGGKYEKFIDSVECSLCHAGSYCRLRRWGGGHGSAGAASESGYCVCERHPVQRHGHQFIGVFHGAAECRLSGGHRQ